MTEDISAVIYSEEKQTENILKLYTEEFGKFCFYDAGADMSEIFNTLSGMSKSVFIIDVSVNTKKYLDFISDISAACPECKIIAVSDSPSVDLIVKVMRSGAKDFISAPVIKSELFDILNKIYNQFHTGSGFETKSRVITVFSNKGGIGKTSIASNLALELAKITKENVALVDLNFQFGDITTFLDLKPSFNISYVLENLNRINSEFLLNTLEKYKNTSLYILADPPCFKQAENVTKAQIAKLVELLKNTFSYTILFLYYFLNILKKLIGIIV